MTNYQRLESHILELSEASHFSIARTEWQLTDVEFRNDWDNCPCSQDIKELCHIENQLNQNKTYVGNVCINKFIGINTGNLFAGLKRIAKDNTSNPNEDLIVHSYQLGYIYESEYHFLMQIKRKRNLSEKQTAWKKKINRRIINKIIVS